MLALLAALGTAACATEHTTRVPMAMGGSVTDFDRGTGAFYVPHTSGVAGTRDTIGIALTPGGGSSAADVPDAWLLAGPPPRAPRFAGPMMPRWNTPENIRRVQHALRQRGYLQGPESGVADAALTGAL